MIAVEPRYVIEVLEGSGLYPQSRVALGANIVRSMRQAQCTLVLYVTKSALRGKDLTRVVNRRVVAGQASFFGYVLTEESCPHDMAKITLTRKDRMRS